MKTPETLGMKQLDFEMPCYEYDKKNLRDTERSYFLTMLICCFLLCVWLSGHCILGMDELFITFHMKLDWI